MHVLVLPNTTNHRSQPVRPSALSGATKSSLSGSARRSRSLLQSSASRRVGRLTGTHPRPIRASRPIPKSHPLTRPDQVSTDGMEKSCSPHIDRSTSTVRGFQLMIFLNNNRNICSSSRLAASSEHARGSGRSGPTRRPGGPGRSRTIALPPSTTQRPVDSSPTRRCVPLPP